MIYDALHEAVVCYYVTKKQRKLFAADLLITPSSISFSSGVLVIFKCTVKVPQINSINARTILTLCCRDKILMAARLVNKT